MPVIVFPLEIICYYQATCLLRFECPSSGGNLGPVLQRKTNNSNCLDQCYTWERIFPSSSDNSLGIFKPACWIDS